MDILPVVGQYNSMYHLLVIHLVNRGIIEFKNGRIREFAGRRRRRVIDVVVLVRFPTSAQDLFGLLGDIPERPRQTSSEPKHVSVDEDRVNHEDLLCNVEN